MSPLLHPLLLEREAELEGLAAAFGRAEAGEGSLVVVEGPTGVGKSDLLVIAEDMALDRGFAPLLARGSELERDFPFGVVLQLLERLITSLAPREREALLDGPARVVAPLFPTLRPAGGLDAEDPYALVHGTSWLIARLADRAPLALVVDDAQWIDERSLEVLRYLAARIADLPVVVVVAGLPELTPDGPLAQLAAAIPPVALDPQPLTPAGVAKLVLSEFPDAEPEFCTGVSAATAGVPLLVDELLTAVRGQDLTPDAQTASTLGRLGPVEVARAVLERLERLPAGAPALARMAAVLGDDADLHHTARLAGVDERQAAFVLDAMCSAGIAEPDTTIRFRHPIVRSALEASVPPAGRAHAHLQAAQALLVEAAPPERVAGHLVAAQRGGRRWVVEVLRRAAARATADGAPASAARYLQRALAEPPDAATRGEVMLELAHAEAATGTPTARLRINEALEHVDAPDERVQALADLGGVASAGDRTAVIEACEEGLRLARATGADPEAVRWLEAHVLAEARDDPALRARSHALLGSAGPVDDDTPGGRALMAQRALEAALAGRPVGDVRDLAEHALGRGALLAEDRPGGVHVSAAVLALTFADELQSAELTLAMAIERARESGSPEAYARVSGLRAGVALRRGSLSDAIADARASLAACPDRPAGRTVAVLATALLERGETEEAARLVERADPATAHPADAALLLVARARLALAAGEHDRAYADAMTAGEHQRLLLADSPTVLAWRTEAALAAAPSDPAEARRIAVAQLDLARATRGTRACGVALRTAAVVLGGDQGLDLLAQAVETLAGSRALLDRAHTLVAHGEALLAADRAAEGRRALREGLDLAGRCGATALVLRATDALADTGTRAEPRPPIGGEALTPSERRVADLATDGLEPREIADALFLTVKTVDWQLRSACAKLGAGSQDELLDALRRASPVPAADAER